jgi:hypothetical protein
VARKLILGLLLAVALHGFLAEVHSGLDGYDHRRERGQLPAAWRFGSAQTERLEACLAAVRKVVPPGSHIAFVSPPGPEEAELYRWRWAAYLLPEMDVMPLGSPETPRLAEYLVDYRRGFEHPWLTAPRELPGCRLFTVRRP